MPSLSVVVDHSLEPAEAQSRLTAFLTRLLVQFGGQVSDVHQRWDGARLDFSFRLYGAALSGALEVEQRCVRCGLDFPLAALAFKGKAQKTIREELTRVLA